MPMSTQLILWSRTVGPLTNRSSSTPPTKSLNGPPTTKNLIEGSSAVTSKKNKTPYLPPEITSPNFLSTRWCRRWRDTRRMWRMTSGILRNPNASSWKAGNSTRCQRTSLMCPFSSSRTGLYSRSKRRRPLLRYSDNPLKALLIMGVLMNLEIRDRRRNPWLRSKKQIFQ